MDNNKCTTVWAFSGEGSKLPVAIFESKEIAEYWIKNNRVSGILSQYPLNMSIYDWAIRNKIFEPQKVEHKTPVFIQKFTSASQEHYHYEDGE